MNSRAADIKRLSREKRKFIFKNEWQLHTMAIVPVLLIVVFAYLPMVGILIAFEDFIPTKGIFRSPWLGLEHFKYMLLMPDVLKVTLNTLYIAILKLVLGFPVPIIAALLLNEVRLVKFKKTVQTIIYLPYFLSWAVLSGIVLDVFSLSGAVNQILSIFNIPPIYWMGKTQPFIGMLVGTDIWKSFGFGTIVYMAALTGIDKTFYEAAEIDGAGRWKKILHITLPGILPIAMLLGILSLGSVLNAGFEQIFLLINPLVSENTDIIDTFVYRLGFENINYSLSTAVGLFKSVVSLILIASANFLAVKYTDYKIF